MRRDVREEREVQEQANNKAEVLLDQPCYSTYTGRKRWSQSLAVEEYPLAILKTVS